MPQQTTTTVQMRANQWYRVASWGMMSDLWVRCGAPFDWEINSAHPPFHITGRDSNPPYLLHQNILWTVWWGECRIKSSVNTWYRSSFRGDPGI